MDEEEKIGEKGKGRDTGRESVECAKKAIL